MYMWGSEVIKLGAHPSRKKEGKEIGKKGWEVAKLRSGALSKVFEISWVTKSGFLTQKTERKKARKKERKKGLVPVAGFLIISSATSHTLFLRSD